MALWIDLKDGDTVQLGDRLLSGGKTWRTVDQESQLVGREYDAKHWWPMQRLATRPAPGVPEVWPSLPDLPMHARLYYTGLGHRRYKRASVRNGPGEPLVMVSTALEYMKRRDAQIKAMLAAAQAKQ